MPCPFCEPDHDRVVRSTEHAIALRDGFPISEGHTLVVPRRHRASLFDLTPGEREAVWELVAEVRDQIAQDLAPDGFNIGLNDGEAAGQTIMHAHVHVIPRRRGDTPDPRGGVRWVLPDRAAYWEDR
jgi:diadenosine tetraphosphate (Ap4A) HIT family hydrolase